MAVILFIMLSKKPCSKMTSNSSAWLDCMWLFIVLHKSSEVIGIVLICQLQLKVALKG